MSVVLIRPCCTFRGLSFLAAALLLVAMQASKAAADAVEWTEMYVPYNEDDESFEGIVDKSFYLEKDPQRQHLHIYQQPSEHPLSDEPSPVFIFGHANGAVAERFRDNGDLETVIASGYSVISWESVTILGTPDTVQTCADDFELVWSWFEDNALAYNFDPDHVIIGGRSRGTICSWALAHSGKPGIKGLYMLDALPNPVWVPEAIWGQVITEHSPPMHLLFNQECPKPITKDCVPSPDKIDIHNPRNGQAIVDRYNKIGIGYKVQLTDGLTNNGNDPYSFFSDFAASLSSEEAKPDAVVKVEEAQAETKAIVEIKAELEQAEEEFEAEPQTPTLEEEFAEFETEIAEEEAEEEFEAELEEELEEEFAEFEAELEQAEEEAEEELEAEPQTPTLEEEFAEFETEIAEEEAEEEFEAELEGELEEEFAEFEAELAEEEEEAEEEFEAELEAELEEEFAEFETELAEEEAEEEFEAEFEAELEEEFAEFETELVEEEAIAEFQLAEEEAIAEIAAEEEAIAEEEALAEIAAEEEAIASIAAAEEAIAEEKMEVAKKEAMDELEAEEEEEFEAEYEADLEDFFAELQADLESSPNSFLNLIAVSMLAFTAAFVYYRYYKSKQSQPYQAEYERVKFDGDEDEADEKKSDEWAVAYPHSDA